MTWEVELIGFLDKCYVLVEGSAGHMPRALGLSLSTHIAAGPDGSVAIESSTVASFFFGFLKGTCRPPQPRKTIHANVIQTFPSGVRY